MFENDDYDIRLDGVSKSFDETTALHSTDLELAPGSTTLLIGPSGSGKSTLLRLTTGLLEPDTGSVFFRGECYNPGDDETLRDVRREIGYVIQGGGLFPHMTARENATVMARHLEWSRSRIDDRLEHLVEMTHFPEDGLDRHPARLSGGQKQRVSLMRALMLDPSVLLFDEPLGALDPMIRADLQEELRQLFRELDKTVLLVTHDLHEAAFFGGRVVLMRQGRVVQRGPLRELLDTPEDPFVTRFIEAQRSEWTEESPSEPDSPPS